MIPGGDRQRILEVARERSRTTLRQRADRLRRVALTLVQAALATGLAWLLARDVADHDDGRGRQYLVLMHTNGALRVHGSLLAGEAGELVGVSGTTIGQWARWGYIRSSQSDGEPRVYSVEDVGEAAVVAELLARGVRHADVRRAIVALEAGHGAWPLSDVDLATTAEDDPAARPRIVLRQGRDAYALTPRGWQLLAVPPRLRDVRLRLRRASFAGARPG